MLREIICYGYHQFESPESWTPTGPPPSYPMEIIEDGQLPPGWTQLADTQREFSSTGGYVFLCPACSLRHHLETFEAQLEDLRKTKEISLQEASRAYAQRVQDINDQFFRAMGEVVSRREKAAREFKKQGNDNGPH